MRIISVVAAALTTLSLTQSVLAETVVVTAARMVDVLAGRETERPQVLITDGRIVSVGHQGDPVPTDAKKLDLGDRTLLPGFIDMHVHLTSDPTFSGYRKYEFTDSFWVTVGVANARKTVRPSLDPVQVESLRAFSAGH